MSTVMLWKTLSLPLQRIKLYQVCIISDACEGLKYVALWWRSYDISMITGGEVYPIQEAWIGVWCISWILLSRFLWGVGWSVVNSIVLNVMYTWVWIAKMLLTFAVANLTQAGYPTQCCICYLYLLVFFPVFTSLHKSHLLVPCIVLPCR